MEKFGLILVLMALLNNANAAPLDEDYGYVDVRDGAHMFWVVYHTELLGDWSTHPLILWLQGGPGSSGVGYGNFWELGPYDVNYNLRDGRWTKKANLMFVDNPVGTGYSYVDSNNLFCTNNSQIAADLVTFLTSVFANYTEMQQMPFYIYAESYGGKMTADFAIALDEAIANGNINCNFKGIAMGDSWISPMDSVNTWGSYLYWMGIVNKKEQAQIDAAAAQTQSAVDEGDWNRATTEWSITEGVVETVTNGVDFYNVLVEDSDTYFLSDADNEKYSDFEPEMRKSFIRHVRPYSNIVGDELDDLMNGPQKVRWNIPDEVVWGGQSNQVFDYLRGDFMKPVVDSVAYLLNNSNIVVNVYSGDLDLICDTPGTYQWIGNMNYIQKTGYEAAERDPLYVYTYPNVAAYVQRYERFAVFTILRSGHMVPIDAPDMALNMIDIITGFGNGTVNAAKQEPELAKQKVEKEEPSNKVHHAMKMRQAKTKAEELKEKHAEAKQTLHEKAETKKKIQEKANELQDKKKQDRREVLKQKLEEVKQKEEKQEKTKLDDEANKEDKVKIVKEAMEEIKESQEDEKETETIEKIHNLAEAIQKTKEEQDKENKERKLRIKKKMLALKAKNAEKEKERQAHLNSLHKQLKQQPKHDEKTKPVHPNHISLNLKPKDEQKH